MSGESNWSRRRRGELNANNPTEGWGHSVPGRKKAELNKGTVKKGRGTFCFFLFCEHLVTGKEIRGQEKSRATGVATATVLTLTLTSADSTCFFKKHRILFQRDADFSTHVVDFDLVNLEPQLSVDAAHRCIDRARGRRRKGTEDERGQALFAPSYSVSV